MQATLHVICINKLNLHAQLRYFFVYRKADEDKVCPDEDVLNRLAAIGSDGTSSFFEMKEYDIFPQIIEQLKVR